MRRRRSSFRKEKMIMLASSCLVLTALTVTGLYVRNLGEEDLEENVVDFTALEDEEESLTMLGSQTEDRADGQASGGQTADGPEADAAGAEGAAQDFMDGPEVLEAEPEDAEASAAEHGAADMEAAAADAETGGEMADAADSARADEPERTEAGEAALAANASDAIAKSSDTPEDADAMSASSLLDFTDSDTLVWPIVGNVLVSYSMDKTVYFATLDQYKYSPAIVIAATEGEGITAAADGQVTDIYQDPETGTTVVMNLGDGYELTYGQLTDLAVDVGDMVATGDLIGNVAAPTMYYSVEGTNVYFKLTKDGVPVDPMSRLS